MVLDLQFVMDLARNGELKQLSNIAKTDRVVLGFINLGLIELNKEFRLATDEFIINLVSGKTIYKLDGTDTDVTDSAGVQLAAGQVMQIISAYEETGESIAINSTRDPLAIFTPTPNTIQVPAVVTGSYISIVYAKTAKIIVADVDATFNSSDALTNNPTVDLPEELLTPLLHFIGYRGHGAVKGEINAENNTHLMRYKASVEEVKQLGLQNSDDLGFLSIQEKGYV